jgi:hypothetical protein
VTDKMPPVAMSKLMARFRSFFWFDKDELAEIGRKITVRKWSHEARWEAEVLLPLAILLGLGFGINIWLGLLSMLIVKNAMQALNKKRFFDPLA